MVLDRLAKLTQLCIRIATTETSFCSAAIPRRCSRRRFSNIRANFRRRGIAGSGAQGGRFKISNSARDLQVNTELKSLTASNGMARRIKIPVDICIRESSSILEPSFRSSLSNTIVSPAFILRQCIERRSCGRTYFSTRSVTFWMFIFSLSLILFFFFFFF